jgi:hypothetical protein
MSRIYTVSFSGVAVSAVQDLLAVYSGSSMAFAVHSIQIGQITQTSVEAVRISLKRLPATVTTGSGGTGPTPQPASAGDSAATVTARANDTTQATTNGTAVTLLADAFNLVNGYQWIFPPDDRPVAKLSEAIVLSLDSAPSAARTMSGTIVVEELF